jgi:PAS domain S-box-containing protein
VSTSRIDTVLIGEGRQLSDLLAGLATRSRLLRMEIVAVVDVGPGPEHPALDHARDIGVPLVGRSLDEINCRGDCDLVIMAIEGPEADALRARFPAHLPVLGPRIVPVVEGIVRLIDANRALRADSRRLKETRLRLNQFVETASLAIYLKDNNLRYTRMNRHALHVLGLSEDQVVGRSDHSVYPGGGARWLQKVERETLRTRQTLHASGVLPVQGQDMHVQVTLFPIIENGLVEGLYGLIEDTTELFESEQKLHQVDEQLNETQKYLREVLENSRDMIFLTDPQGHLLSFNSGAEQVLGYRRDEIVGSPARLLSADPDNFDAIFAATLRDGHATEYEMEFRGRDNRQVICNTSLTLIDGPDGAPLEIVGLCRDITTRLRLKDDLIRSERLAAVGQLASGVAHEINNPLAVIDTIAGLVTETLQDEGDALKPETLQILTKAVDRLRHQVQRVTTITHSLLGFVRKPQSGMSPVNVHELLEESLNVLGSELRRSQTEVVRHYSSGVPELVSDPLLLEQVFVNLIGNAVDAMVEAVGRPGVLELSTSLDEKFVTVGIQDNGVGIPKADQEKIFNLFHTTKPAGKGTGLGLSIVHDIMYRLGGSIRVASEPGQWSRFVVAIPLQPPETPLPDPSISL